VLKGAALSPRKHDPSIPEPLAEVAMRALSASTDVRYKDGHEAEKALKNAWDACLKGNLVSTASLAGDEMPHERVGAEMHSTGGIAALGVATTQAAPVTAQTTQKDPTSQGVPRKPMLVIESGKVASDDDPTTILIRDSGPTKVDDHLALEDSGIRGDEDDRKPTTAEPLAPRRGSGAARDHTSTAAPSSARLWVLILLLAVTAGAAGAWYFLRGGF